VRLEPVTEELREVPVRVEAFAVIVPEPPRAIDVPLTVKELLVKATVGVALSPELLESVIPLPATSDDT
jgi:hypothetical protein